MSVQYRIHIGYGFFVRDYPDENLQDEYLNDAIWEYLEKNGFVDKGLISIEATEGMVTQFMPEFHQSFVAINRSVMMMEVFETDHHENSPYAIENFPDVATPEELAALSKVAELLDITGDKFAPQTYCFLTAD